MELVDYQSDYGILRKVALYRPRLDEMFLGDPAHVMYRSRPEPSIVMKEFDALVEKLLELGVEVILLEDHQKRYPTSYNLIFLRDVALVIRDKIILSNMRFEIRRQEPSKFRSLLTDYSQHYASMILTIRGDNSFEGADFLVSGSNSVYSCTSNRTSVEAVNTLAETLNLNVTYINGSMRNLPQHLLGGFHMLSELLIARRIEYCRDKLDGIDFVDFEESTEVTELFSLNFLTLAPNVILMPDNCPKTRDRLESYGIECHVTSINEIHKMGGGIACMTLPLVRTAL